VVSETRAVAWGPSTLPASRGSRLLRLFRLIPEELDLSELLDEARRQLHTEADYLAEATALDDYGAKLGDTSGFTLPVVDSGRTTGDVLAMSFVLGEPIETLRDAPRRLRNRVGSRLMDLVLRETLQWCLVQTDANFANYRYDAERDCIGLLDFGATRRYEADWIERFRALIKVAVAQDHAAIEAQAINLGYLRPEEDGVYRRGLTEMVAAVAEPARTAGAFNFAASDLARRVGDQATELRLKQRYWHLPPPGILFLHRKLAGTHPLCAKLRAQVDVRSLIEEYLG
jgi:predicted unusual protein kinase regulating ubiquinone biosynthesis (AarF/ABC1/UbiB family)